MESNDEKMINSQNNETTNNNIFSDFFPHVSLFDHAHPPSFIPPSNIKNRNINHSNSFSQFFLQNTINTSTNTPQKIVARMSASMSSDSLIATSHRDKSITLYDYQQSMTQLQQIAVLSDGHKGIINNITFGLRPNLLATASDDATVVCWDTRTAKSASVFHPKHSLPLYSCAFSEDTLVAGGDENIYLWDFRKQNNCAVIENYHSEGITQLQFHPKNPRRLFSSGLDGFINQYNLEINDFEDDDTLITTLNTDNSVSRFGFFGPNAEFLYNISTIETLNLWNIQEAIPVSKFPKIRSELTTYSSRVDYLIDCHYEPISKNLFLLAGAFDGRLMLSHVRKSNVQPIWFQKKKKGHSDVVRDILWFDESFLSGGQDGKICIWSTSPSTSASLSPTSPQSTTTLSTSPTEVTLPSSSSSSSYVMKKQKKNRRQKRPY